LFDSALTGLKPRVVDARPMLHPRRSRASERFVLVLGLLAAAGLAAAAFAPGSAPESAARARLAQLAGEVEDAVLAEWLRAVRELPVRLDRSVTLPRYGAGIGMPAALESAEPESPAYEALAADARNAADPALGSALARAAFEAASGPRARAESTLLLVQRSAAVGDTVAVAETWRAARGVRGEEWDRVQGFEYGADDYIVKPFSTRELLLRMRAVLRRTEGEAPGVQREERKTRFGACEVDFAAYTVTRDGTRQGLSRQELELLRAFLGNPATTLPREKLLDLAWGRDEFPTTRTVDMHVLKLRKKIERDPEDPRHIVTVHGVGYRFER